VSPSRPLEPVSGGGAFVWPISNRLANQQASYTPPAALDRHTRGCAAAAGALGHAPDADRAAAEGAGPAQARPEAPSDEGAAAPAGGPRAMQQQRGGGGGAQPHGGAAARIQLYAVLVSCSASREQGALASRIHLRRQCGGHYCQMLLPAAGCWLHAAAAMHAAAWLLCCMADSRSAPARPIQRLQLCCRTGAAVQYGTAVQ
jgi:hypothetical protein